MNNNHKKLLQQSAQQNLQAFKELYEQTSPSIYSLALHFLHKKQIAEAVLQDIYIEVWQCCALYNSEKSNATTWILNIARKKVMNKRNELNETSLTG